MNKLIYITLLKNQIQKLNTLLYIYYNGKKLKIGLYGILDKRN